MNRMKLENLVITGKHNCGKSKEEKDTNIYMPAVVHRERRLRADLSNCHPRNMIFVYGGQLFLNETPIFR